MKKDEKSKCLDRHVRGAPRRLLLVRDVDDFSGKDRFKVFRWSIDETIQKRDSRQDEGETTYESV